MGHLRARSRGSRHTRPRRDCRGHRDRRLRSVCARTARTPRVSLRPAQRADQRHVRGAAAAQCRSRHGRSRGDAGHGRQGAVACGRSPHLESVLLRHRNAARIRSAGVGVVGTVGQRRAARVRGVLGRQPRRGSRAHGARRARVPVLLGRDRVRARTLARRSARDPPAPGAERGAARVRLPDDLGSAHRAGESHAPGVLRRRSGTRRGLGAVRAVATERPALGALRARTAGRTTRSLQPSGRNTP